MADTDQKTAKIAEDGKVVIKKYANRRLYNTQSSSYVTLDHLAQMVREGHDFVVFDARTNEDITRSVLTQIIFDEESRGQNLLPLQFLRQLIRFYGDSMQAFVPSYLEASLDGFAREQERMQAEWAGAGRHPGAAAAGAEAYTAFQAQVRRNIAMFDQAMRVFSPFNYARPEGGEADAAAVKPAGSSPVSPPAAPPAPAPAAEEGSSALADMKKQMEAMQKQISALAAKK